MASAWGRICVKIVMGVFIVLILSCYKFSNEYSPSQKPSHIGRSRFENEFEFQNWRKTQENRKLNIEKTCQKYGSSIQFSINRNNLMHDPIHKLLFCPIAKVGSTTWLSLFLQLSSSNKTYTGSNSIHKHVPPLFPFSQNDPDAKTLAETTVSFSMVRHPFERLVSAYQDKVVDGAHQIISKVASQYGDISFPNFVKGVLSQAKSKCRHLSHCGVNGHWVPFISQCAFCSVPYAVIANAETFEEDKRFIGMMAGIQFEDIQERKSSGGGTAELARKYFKQLDRKSVDELFEFYKVDFEMFGYSPEVYQSYSKH